MKKKIIIVLLLLALVATNLIFNKKEANIETAYAVPIKKISKRGNAILDISLDELNGKNIELADVVKISFGETTLIIPFGTNYSDVDTGETMLRYDKDDDEIGIVVNGGNFANKYGVAVSKEISEDPGYVWEINYDSVEISLEEKEGYAEQYRIRNLERSNNRDDYPQLDDRQFANYRNINTTGIGENMLYRGSTPIDNGLGRNEYIMSFLEEDGIKTIINLNNPVSEAKELCPSDSYYHKCNVHYAEMAYDYSSDIFKEKVKGCIRFINENDGPYYIHCKEGKDRTGFICALIECYMGADYNEIIDDYMETYLNYYKIEKNDETYNATIKNNIEKMLCDAFEVTDLKNAALDEEAREYFVSAGLSTEELLMLKQKLS